MIQIICMLLQSTDSRIKKPIMSSPFTEKKYGWTITEITDENLLNFQIVS